MGQCASSRRQSSKSKKELNTCTKVWMDIKTQEVEALKQSTADAHKDIEKLRKQFLCQSTILKEIFDDLLRLQNKETEALKLRVQQLETALAASALAQSSSTMAVTTVAENNKHFV
jgi:hypothetical protein